MEQRIGAVISAGVAARLYKCLITPNFLLAKKRRTSVNAVIEIPKDSVNKYEYDKDLHVFKLYRTLFSPVHYPGDYGFIPSHSARTATRWTCWCWGGPQSFPGCLIEVGLSRAAHDRPG